MPVSLMYAGRLGNNFVQISRARLLAEDNDMILETPWVRPEICAMTPCASGAREAGMPISGETRFDDDHPPVFKGLGHRHILDGYWQHGEHLIPHRKRIQDFFRWPQAHFDKGGNISLDFNDMAPIEKLTKNTQDLGVHVRLTDGKTLGGVSHIVEPEWYAKVIDPIAKNYRRIVVFTDDRWARGMFDVFSRYPNAVIKSQDVSKDYIEMLAFTDFVMAPSTFSWTSCFLGHSERVWQIKQFITLPNVRNMALPWAEQVEGRFIP